ncbi:MAG: PAS domain-containing protein, partial [Myxococcales bacterium]|nr:PAS domain-containing protein [Myxococcales bacterium]
MAKTAIVPINEERSFEPQELFFSLTDRKGVIRYGNEVFTRISGYSEEELIGEPHNIIRHPDMPRAVFKLLWDYLEAGKSIAAYVKNLAKDGRYYWVLATVTPTPTGYLSIRLKPSSPLFDAAQAVYKKALEVEKEVERETGNRKMAMARSLEFIVGQLRASGFDSYDHFMSEALSLEITSREKWLRDMGYQGSQRSERPGDSGLVRLVNSCDVLSGLLTSVFSSLDAFKRLGSELAGKYEMIQELAPSLQFLALNARMAASRLGDKGVVQAAVADALGGK